MTDLPPIVSTDTLVEWMHRDFAGFSAGLRLAAALGVCPATASNLRNGISTSHEKLAAYYGYVATRDRRGDWRLSETPVHPTTVGYQQRWIAAVIEELRALAATPKPPRPRVAAVAKRLGVADSTLRGVMRKADIKLRSQEIVDV